ncbi:FecCD family ABC transporter permease [Bifidobacterium tibiigranuli]|jgi:iron complex transport system permease protein|uniref:FecCD family ABC transporter permease n=2 Tax=Bifidobacterium tibiigranuli TaxID=2172043 RepID=UPI0026F246F0|nr:iron ABC transporter permease [Bifidobacterium tibiigranuli]MCI1650410.1 iron ABC transporter permease [Bifidobacterium tibiigranuli]MCI2184907.1 iron ABC transporter permease [Bifidobacterium tibiigranuli]MCI2204856.1 iron ABC transporter permease [Bifidobacterium tibiigranuli]
MHEMQPPEADAVFGVSRRRTAIWIAVLILLLIASLLAVGIGSVTIPPATVARILTHQLFGFPRTPSWSNAQELIVTQVRFPRVLLGMVVGAGLAISGMALQAMTRNILAEPYLLGVVGGASTGAALTILFGVGVGIGGSQLTGSAFAGALLAMALVLGLGRSGGQVTSTRLLLAGVAVGYVLNAATSFMIFAAHSAQGAQDVLFWLLGSLGLADWNAVSISGIIVAVAFLVLLGWSRRLDALSIGDETARSLGLSPSRVRVELLVVVALCVAAVVAVSGGIAFVGLIVPHVARLCTGSVHRVSLISAALIGAIFLVWADALARAVLAPADVPIGIITAVVGAPMLFILIRRYRAYGA